MRKAVKNSKPTFSPPLTPNPPKTLRFSYSSFQKLKRLRLLDLSHTDICKLESVNPFALLRPLKHLRYLNLSNTDIQSLPDPICRFFRALQVLKLENCPKLEKLPRDLNRLISLRYIHVNMQSLSSLPSKLGMLMNLECLNSYAVGSDEGKKVSELRNMEHLTEICISWLDRVSCLREAQDSMLSTKVRLSKLTLEWNSSVTQMVKAADVLEGLEPDNGLKDLTIRNYPGQQFPSWLTSTSRKLVSIYLVHCDGCNALPPLGQLPVLKTLVLDSFESLEIVDRGIIGDAETGFPRLESIELRDIVKLHHWEGITVNDMPCLRRLRIIDCPRLAYLPSTLNYACLTTFKIEGCPKLDRYPEFSSSLKRKFGEVIMRDRTSIPPTN